MWPPIEPGSGKEPIRVVQQMLSILGADVAETGEWDTATREAVASRLGKYTGDEQGKAGLRINGRMFVGLLGEHARQVNKKAIAKAAAGGASAGAVIAEIINRLSSGG